MNQEFNWLDMYAPEDEDCSSGQVPPGSADEKERVIQVADKLATMPKLFFRREKKEMFDFLDQCLQDGIISRLAGVSVINRQIDRTSHPFPDYSFRWRDRTCFDVYVEVRLNLDTAEGPVLWHGYIILRGSINKDFTFIILGIDNIENMPDKEEDTILDAFMVPILTGRKLDQMCEILWDRYIPGAAADPKKRDPEKLAQAMGLSVECYPVYMEKSIGSILFFDAGELETGTFHKDAPEKRSPNKGHWIYEKTVKIPAKTIVVNTNRVPKQYAAFFIYHECIHYHFHYLFYCLQEWHNNDIRPIPKKKIVLTPGEKVTDPIFWVEKQANRGAYGMMIPETWIREIMHLEISRLKEKPRHAGYLYDIIGRQICWKYRYANFRLRARMIQLGCIAAKGALNWFRGGIRVEPFAFHSDSCRQTQETFLIDPFMVDYLYEHDDAFRAVMDTGWFIYAEGHIVLNDPEYVVQTGYVAKLTPKANAHVDQCCLRFWREYIQDLAGYYVFGRMNAYDEYIEQTRFYLGDEHNQGLLNWKKEQEKYRAAFPDNFWDGLKQLMEKNKMTQEDITWITGIPLRTFQRWVARRQPVCADFVIMLSLAMKLPEWLSSLLLDRAGVKLNEKKDRDAALISIQTVMWMDGIEKANEYLAGLGFSPLQHLSA